MAGKTAGAILVATTVWSPEPWAAAVRKFAPDRTVFVWPDIPDRAAVRYALAWKPAPGALADLPNLAAIFSLGAGVEHIVFQPDLPDVPLLRIVDENLTERMTEWIVLQVLMHHRQQRAYDRLQRDHLWREQRQPAAREVRVGIMGMGVLGRDGAEVLMRLGFQVAGWSRRPTKMEGVQSFAGTEQLDAFLARTDILVSLLPLTEATRGILAMPLFRKLARDGRLGAPVLINAGRGGLQVEADIAAALDQGILGGASLDVFETEPLPATSPLWDQPNVVVTPHAAAWSSPEALMPGILAQIAAHEAGRPVTHLVDRTAQY